MTKMAETVTKMFDKALAEIQSLGDMRSFVRDYALLREFLDEPRIEALGNFEAELEKIPDEGRMNYWRMVFDSKIKNWELLDFKQLRKLCHQLNEALRNIPEDLDRFKLYAEITSKLEVEEFLHKERLKVVRQAAGRGFSLTSNEVLEKGLVYEKTKAPTKTNLSAAIDQVVYPELSKATLADRIRQAREGAGLVKQAGETNSETVDLEIGS